MEEQTERYYRSLYEAAAAVNSAHTVEDVLDSIVKSVAKALESKGCSLMLLSPDKKLLLYTASCGLSSRYVRKGPVSSDVSIAEALKGRAVGVVNATKDSRIQYQKQAIEEGIVSILSVPVMLKGKVIGVMRVYTSEPRYFTYADIDFVSAVANLGAIALENARLYDSVEKDYEALRSDLAEWRAALGHEWSSFESVNPT